MHLFHLHFVCLLYLERDWSLSYLYGPVHSAGSCSNSLRPCIMLCVLQPMVCSCLSLGPLQGRSGGYKVNWTGTGLHPKRFLETWMCLTLNIFQYLGAPFFPCINTGYGQVNSTNIYPCFQKVISFFLEYDEDILGRKLWYRLRNINKLTINPSKDEFNLYCNYSCYSYSTVHTILVYKMQSANALQGNNRCFLRSVQNTHVYCAVWI